MKESIVGGKAYLYALRIVPVYRKMIEQKEYIISKQLLRCSTSIGANIEEATAACSRRDFIAKMAIASKEARESRYWIRLIADSNIIENQDYNELENEIEEIIRMMTNIVKTSQMERQI